MLHTYCSVSHVRWAPNGTFVVILSQAGDIYVYSPKTGARITTIKDEYVWFLSISPDSQFLFTVSKNNNDANIWEVFR